MEQQKRKYPVGIQTFSRMIREGYVYVDKTDLVWQLAHFTTFVFLSRPRRFGKSLLTSTLDAYWRGEEDLFKGLKVMDYETDWVQYPVIHLDLSIVKGKSCADDLRRGLLWLLTNMEGYEREDLEESPGEILNGMINRLYKRTGKQVVVIIDEYDAPLLDVLHRRDLLQDMRAVMQEFYQPLKVNEPRIKFCFITGITKFSQLSIFSTLNNLTNVTLDPRFSAICGITEEELTSTLWQDVEDLAGAYGISSEEMHQRLKMRYDGYHFSENSPEVYNPFSLLKAFLRRKVANYWFESGTPTFLIRQLQYFHTDITALDTLEVPASSFDQPTENMQDALPLLYQSGYLTIKDYDPEGELYTLSIPNQEVRIGYTEGLLPAFTGLNGGEVQAGFALKFWRALKSGDIDLALRHLQAYLAGLPYVEGFKKKLREAATAEGFYEYTFYLIFSMLNVYVRTQVKVAHGRVDVVVFMSDTIYIFELKVNESARAALSQIDNHGYAAPYASDSRRVVKVGVKVDKETRTIENWAVGT